MAVKAFRTRDKPSGRDRAYTVRAAYFGIHDSSPGRDWAVIGAGVKIIHLERDSSPGRDSASVGVLRGFAIHDFSPSRDRARLRELPVHLVAFGIHDSSPGRDTALLSVLRGFSAPDTAVGRDSLLYEPRIPAIAVPVGSQQWGTVNLVRNPSLSYEDVGLLDWFTYDAVAPVALSRSSATAAVGSHAGLASLTGFTAVDPGDSHGIFIRTQQRLNRSMQSIAGSFSLYTPDLADIWYWLRFTYMDGTDLDGTVYLATNHDDVDQDAAFTQSTWNRIEFVDSPDPFKPINHIELYVATPEHAADSLFRVDAVQIEESLSGGPTPYVDGDQGENAHWLGPAGRSMSFRETA
jgi:hypothetical protein